MPRKKIYFFYLILVSGCTEMLPEPGISNLEWTPKEIQTTECPNLSGKYYLQSGRDGDIRYIFLGTVPSIYSSREDFISHRDLPVYISVKNGDSSLLIELKSGEKSITKIISYDGVHIGCSSNMVVSRYINPLRPPGENGGCTSLSYGEYRASLRDNGDIEINRTQRTRCATWGFLKDKLPNEIINPNPYIFKRIGSENK